MIINVLLLMLGGMILYSVIASLKRQSNGKTQKEFLSIESTGALRGLAIIMIAFAHIC